VTGPRDRLGAALVLAGCLAALGVAAVIASGLTVGPWAAAMLVRALAMLASVAGGGPVAASTLRLADPGHPGRPGPADPQVLHGGAWVGVLERIGICGTLLAGWPEGVALVMAVKGLGRYAELRDSPVAAERFIIGTAASVLWACAVGGVGLEALDGRSGALA
jgi:hypothetical protein